MPNHDFDDLFDAWGKALNVDPQLAKTVFHTESEGQLGVKSNGGAVGPMQMKPATARAMAQKMGLDPNSVDLHDMRWSIPLAMRYLADGLAATKSAEGALGYYSTGSADPKRWSQGYLNKAARYYPDMAIAAPQQPQDGGDGSTVPVGAMSPQDPQEPPKGQAIVDTAAKLAGADSASIRPFLQQTGQSLDPTRANWCAAFVNGVLGANGVEGTQGPGKNVATGFLNWGEQVPEPQPGDVLVLPRGHPAGGLGGHVGIATGQIADGPQGPIYLMQSGNLEGAVRYSWEPAASVVVRRAPGQAQPAQAPAEPQATQPFGQPEQATQPFTPPTQPFTP